MSGKNNGLFVWCYYLKLKDLSQRKSPAHSRPWDSLIHKTRDGLAQLELVTTILELDRQYTYKGPVLSLPFTARSRFDRLLRHRPSEEQPGPRDLVLLVTRPPLDDTPGPLLDSRSGSPEADKRPVIRGGNRLEDAIFRALRGFFALCTRSDIHLHATLQTDHPGADDWRALEFHQRQGGAIKFERRSARAGEPALAAGYLAVVPPGPDLGFRLICAFSSGGSETLIYAWLLRHEPAYRNCLATALHAKRPVLWQMFFRDPEYIPQPVLAYDLNALVAEGTPPAIRWSLP